MIDGDHTYDGVQADFVCYSPKVRVGGLVLFHDTLAPAFPSVGQFVNTLRVDMAWELATLPFYFGLTIARRLR